MKIKELVKQLYEIDPTGETEVVTDEGDIFIVESQPAYWDGHLEILIRDESKKPYYDIVGIRELTEGRKIRLRSESLEDICYDAVWFGREDRLIIEGRENFKARAEKCVKEAIEQRKGLSKQAFIKFWKKKFGTNKDGSLFFHKYQDKLWRRDFNMINSSIRDKEKRYWNDCVQLLDGEVKFLEEYFNKDYNN